MNETAADRTSTSRSKMAGMLGLSAVALFITALVVFSFINPQFHILNDFVSHLGALGEPFALWWNLIGFLSVGILLAAFGITYGLHIQDRLAGALLALFGVGFAITAIPIELQDGRATVTVAHTVAICLGLACWMFALARMNQLQHLSRFQKQMANWAAILVVLPVFGQVLELWPMPLTHRLVFAVVFIWTALISWQLLRERTKQPPKKDLQPNLSGN